MTTARFLALILLLLTALSVLAFWWRPDAPRDGKTPLVWVSDNNPVRTAQIEAFNAGHPDFDLQLDYGNTGLQKVILQCSSGIGPDIFDFGADQLDTLVAAGILWDVTEPAKTMGFSAERDLWPGARKTVEYAGHQYGYPCNTSTQILIFNKNIFDHYGIPYPTGRLTWDEFFALARKVSSITTGKAAGDAPVYGVTGLGYDAIFASQRGEYFDENGLLNVRNNAALRKALELYRDMLFTHRIAATAAEAKSMSGQGGWGGGSLNQFSLGRYAMAVTGHYSLIAFNRAHQKQLEDLARRGLTPEQVTDPLQRPIRVGAVLLPHFPGQEPCYQVISRVAGINAKSPRRKEALQFLQFLAGPVYAETVNQGTDALPGNPRYAELGVEPGPEDLSRLELQRVTEEAMTMGYVPRASPYLLINDVIRVIRSQISRLESNPSLEIDGLLENADHELQRLMRRTLDRNPQLRDQFVANFGADALKNLP